MERDFLERVLLLYKENQWRCILELNKQSDCEIARNLLWVWPSEQNLYFIKRAMRTFRAKGVISLGCGCGLFEWILQQHSGLSVLGYEVNEEWWTSRYSNPQFINLQFPDLPPSENIFPQDFALLFCYFNNGPAFQDYISCYRGKVVIIIGPGDGAGRHTNPQPFNPDFGCSNWTLCDYEEVKNTRDFIAVYYRSQ